MNYLIWLGAILLVAALIGIADVLWKITGEEDDYDRYDR